MTAFLSSGGTETPVEVPFGTRLAGFLNVASVVPRPNQVVALEGEVVPPGRFEETEVREEATVTVDELVVGG